MKAGILCAISIATIGFNLVSALPHDGDRKLVARQSIDFDLVDSTPDPTVQPEDRSHFNAAAAIASVVAAINADPLPQTAKRSLEARDVLTTTSPGYTPNTLVANAAMSVPLDCNKRETYMGAKLFTNMAFDTALCAAACSAQSAYNLRHPPANGPAQTCQFYNTYAMYKNDVYQGQYCTMYNQTWDAKYATNKGQTRGGDRYTIQYSYIASNVTYPGQCQQAAAPAPPATTLTPPTSTMAATTDPSTSTSSTATLTPTAPTKTPLDLTATTISFGGDPEDMQSTIEKNLVSITLAPWSLRYGTSARIYFPVVANELYEISWDFYQEPSAGNDGHYFTEVGDDGYEAVVYWTQNNPGAPVQFYPSYSAALSDGTGAEMDACWRNKVVPQTTPASGVWNTAKVVLKPRVNMGYFRWDFSAQSGGNALQWKNVYVTKLPSDYCKAV
ncbi:MAG: hypothetical protein Q9219_007419 [cf. Caloplaca sp. 3 TL-2023]